MQHITASSNATLESSNANLPGTNHAEQPTFDEEMSEFDIDEGRPHPQGGVQENTEEGVPLPRKEM